MKRKPLQCWYFLNTEPVGLFRYTAIALILSMLCHILFYWGAPRLMGRNVDSQAKEQEFVVEYESLDRQIEQFMEANPEALVQEPHDTPFYFDRSQVAAQEHPSAIDNSPIPETKGDLDSQKIVEGSLKVDSIMPSLVTAETEVQKQVKETQYVDPLSPKTPHELKEFSKQQIDLAEGLGIALDKAELSDEEIEEVADMIALAQTSRPQVQPLVKPKPKPRPRVDPRTVPGPLRKQNKGSSNLGIQSLDTKFSEFGEYQQRMIEAIAYKWHALVRGMTPTAQDLNSLVVLRFTLDRNGHVHQLEVVDSSASDLAGNLCKDAVQSIEPYGIWTDEMVRQFGQQKVILFGFQYLMR